MRNHFEQHVKFLLLNVSASNSDFRVDDLFVYLVRIMTNKFDSRLESMRGLAALMVAVHHSMATFTLAEGETRDPFSGILLDNTNPNSAVFFFFVLSGYVLGASFIRSADYLQFALRRITRIFPMFVVAIVVSYGCASLFTYDAQKVSAFFRATHPALHLSDVWDNLLFRSAAVNGPSWSLWPEIKGSLLLPLLVFAHLIAPDRLSGLRGLTLFGCGLVLLIVFARIGIWFYVGFFLPAVIAQLISKMGAPVRFAFLVAGYSVLLFVGVRQSNIKLLEVCLPASLGAAMMIGAVISSPSSFAVLKWRPLRFVGRVSYSFYLIHWPALYLVTVAYTAAPLLPRGHIGNVVVTAGSVCVALAAASITFEVVEKKFVGIWAPAYVWIRRRARVLNKTIVQKH